MKNPSDSTEAPWTIARLIGWTTDFFSARSIDSPRMTAELLLAHSLGISRIDLYLQYDKPLTADELARFKALIKRRADREPVAYIIGTRGFWTLDLDVSPGVLIPRPDTECLVERALIEMAALSTGGRPLTVVDLGTGSGAIVLALASEKPDHRYLAVDLSLTALIQARSNRDRLLPGAPVHFVNGSWLDAFEPRQAMDLIVSNPPYIPRAVIDTLEPEVARFEPRQALDGDHDGLSCIRHIVASAAAFLRPGGVLLMEMGYDQKEAVRALFEASPDYGDVDFFTDYAGRDRVVRARKIQKP
ncbi:peptide chain release factor N(5)-glutamine methyltransferase [Desulfatiferula olefinivorans]